MPLVAILGAHWGDEGKGKIAAALSREADVCARFQGGPNAGHSVLVPGRPEPWVLRMVPSGTLTGATGVVGGGCVIQPRMFLDEVLRLRTAQPDLLDRLIVSPRAHVITDAHTDQDRSGSGVGSTRMGVGPAYRDKAYRAGLRVADLLGPAHRLPESMRAVAAEFGDLLGARCRDDMEYLRGVLDRGGRVVAEGAQGARLDIDHGEYPFVTSSNTTVGAVLTGLGIGPRDVTGVLLVTPAYVTKVGGGALPSRVDHAMNAELRERGQELDGATLTMRDTGWLDVGWLRRAARLNQATGLVLTKVDVLSGLDQVGLYDAVARPPVRTLAGWDDTEVTAGDETGRLGDFVRRVQLEAQCPVACVSRGPGLDDWWWRTERAGGWGPPNAATMSGGYPSTR